MLQSVNYVTPRFLNPNNVNKVVKVILEFFKLAKQSYTRTFHSIQIFMFI